MGKGAPVEIWVGTRKGAFRFRSRSRDRKKWELDEPAFAGQEVHHVAQDPRDPARVYAAVGTAWFGSHLHISEDGGRTWRQSGEGLSAAGLPPDADGKPAALKRIWHIAPGAADDPGGVWLGGDPGVLFRSTDKGASWTLVEGLSLHPSREKFWFAGAGGLMVHSIQPLGKGRIVVGISAAGAFRSGDLGKTWEPHNLGVLADFAPVPFPEVGQCVHKLLAHPKHPSDLYQQNHCGVYKGKFGGRKWTDISEGLPGRFGFALAVPGGEDETIFTLPVKSPMERYVPEGKLRVARSRDAGRTWELTGKGLPQENAFDLVVREAMTSDPLSPAGVYFGTQNGAVYYTRNAGDSWHLLADHLPPVYSVTFATGV